MKLDLFNRQWIDIVFEGRNKAYGAYELRKDDSKTTVRALIIGALVFAIAVSAPLIYNLIPDMSNNDEALDQKIVAIKLPPKEQPKDIPPPPPPPPKVDQVKFVKPVVAKTEEIVEEPPKVEEIKDKKLGAETIKGEENAPLTLDPVGKGEAAVEEDNTIYSSAGIQVPAEYPGGVDKFRKCVLNNFAVPEDEDGLSGKIFISFVVEKDGSLSDLKVLRDIGHGTGELAKKAISSCKVRWNPGEQNGKKVRMAFMLPISIQAQ